ncbi:RsmB/NOP family class I SAM-dependent RNA methyltransferase [Leucobacter luti]|uniref:RsmB/NOP family class I SAM-dependent RNA methyltransferase n=1 Tax=Leucobacter luti TaxID=340320 RepID=UPI003D06804D
MSAQDRDRGRDQRRSGGPRGPRRSDDGPRGARRSGDGGGERKRSGRVSQARLVAYDVLRDVDDRDAYANLALPARIREAGLDERDAALATELAAGSLRLRGRYDRIIELASGRSIEQVDGRTRNVLRLGVHQLLGMRTADHAAVNESVELQRLVANQNAAGFVNGVLRAVGRATNEEWDARIAEEARNADEALAARTSHPAWVLRALRDALKLEGRGAELEELLESDNRPPRVSLAVLLGAGVDAETAAEARALELAGPSPIGLELAGGDPARAIDACGARKGFVRVQDQGSQLAALALTRVRPAAAGERWLDLCAGPGGKSAVLGAEALAAGATVRANEVSDHRADLVRRSIEPVAEAVEVVSHDGRDDAAYGPGSFDRILVDAPCSGLGALRRRPEARWRKEPGDLPGLTGLQRELLEAAVDHLAPGGVLAYVTCSPHLAETRVAVDGLLKRHPELTELDAKQAVQEVARGPLDLPGDALSAQLWPHRHGTDAMFISLITKA